MIFRLSPEIIVWPQAVSEVTMVKMKKKKTLSKILKSPIFLSYRNVIYLKRSLIKSLFIFEIKLEDFIIKKN